MPYARCILCVMVAASLSIQMPETWEAITGQVSDDVNYCMYRDPKDPVRVGGVSPVVPRSTEGMGLIPWLTNKSALLLGYLSSTFSD